MALAGGILGRTDDMIVVRGVNIYPGAVEEIIRATDSVAEYQVQISTARALTELEFAHRAASRLRGCGGAGGGVGKKISGEFCAARAGSGGSAGDVAKV